MKWFYFYSNSIKDNSSTDAVLAFIFSVSECRRQEKRSKLIYIAHLITTSKQSVPKKKITGIAPPPVRTTGV